MSSNTNFNPFEREFMFCYKNKYRNTFYCETGFKTLEEINNKLYTLEEPYQETTFFEVYTHSPGFAKFLNAKLKLTPNIVITPKNTL